MASNFRGNDYRRPSYQSEGRSITPLSLLEEGIGMKFVTVYVPCLGIRQMTPLAFRVMDNRFRNQRDKWRYGPRLVTERERKKLYMRLTAAEKAWARINGRLEFRYGREAR